MTTLKARADFLAVRGGVRASTAAFLMEAKPRRAGPSNSETARIGYTVTKKLGSAVRRNRIRRRLRAAVAATASDLARSGYDYVLVARPAAFDRPFAALVDDMRHAFSNLHSGREPAGRKDKRRPANNR